MQSFHSCHETNHVPQQLYVYPATATPPPPSTTVRYHCTDDEGVSKFLSEISRHETEGEGKEEGEEDEDNDGFDVPNAFGMGGGKGGGGGSRPSSRQRGMGGGGGAINLEPLRNSILDEIRRFKSHYDEKQTAVQESVAKLAADVSVLRAAFR